MYKCVTCGNMFKKGDGTILLPGFNGASSRKGTCKDCMDMDHDDSNYERFGIPKRASFLATHGGLMRHFGKVPEPNDEPDFRQSSKPEPKEGKAKIDFATQDKSCALCGNEFKKGESIKKDHGEYNVHQKCPPFKSFKAYMAGRK
jgi:hypothetical protein